MPAHRPRILNVHDDEVTRYLITRQLTADGFEVIEAADGEQALLRLQSDLDLVVLDVHLPGIDGRKVCEVIKSRSPTASIPVLLISADAFAVNAQPSDADAQLVLSFGSDDLRSTVRALVQHHARQHANAA